ncbi:MAG: GAF domain-containing sensor histidine kinase [Solirubrobacterales bacterium]|nr:GAF domain-containing sensor histidine kinase [Solirubrobacterales bacterium]
MSAPSTEEKLRRLLSIGRDLVSVLDPEAVLRRILEDARAITGARYAALGVLDEQRTQLKRFVTVGIDDDTYRAIGELPRGRGVLGVLINDPRPLRLAQVGDHPKSYGFPAGHPAMGSFLGVPILIRGEAWGNLYLTEKAVGGEFTEEDEEAALILAQLAATAIQNAQLYETSEHQRTEAERALLGLRAARDIADAIAGVGDLKRVLELIVKRGRALVDARTVLIMLREEDSLVVAASAGHAIDARGRRIPTTASTSGRVLDRGRPERIADVSSLMVHAEELGVSNAQTALLVPMIHRGTRVGVLAAFDHGSAGETFTADDEEALRSFASSAGTAVAVHRSVEAERLRAMISAADAERARWARELHDQTLQALGGLRVLLASSLRRGRNETFEPTIRQAIEDVELETDNLRAIISDLRPSLLDDLGLVPALEALFERRRAAGLEIRGEIALPDELPLEKELETTIYRLVQEALTNVVKHARAMYADVTVHVAGGAVVVEVRDDGIGFKVDERGAGFGLAGMRERVYLAGGKLELRSDERGTLVRALLPVGAPTRGALPSIADQVAS